MIIALPILSQPEYIEAALIAGKHVLSEKPIAGDVKRAEQLIKFSKSDKVNEGAVWSVAENFRFLESFEYGKQEIEKLGRILGFRVESFGNVKATDKYYSRCSNPRSFGRDETLSGEGKSGIISAGLIESRNSVAHEARLPRRFPARWWCSLYCCHAPSLGEKL